MPPPEPGPAATTLSKSRYLAGLQCRRRLWLATHEPHRAPPPDAALAARLDMGTEIGRHAHALFPGGVLVAEEAWRHGEAVERTRALAADPSVPAIFEAAFEHEGIRVRVDVLERLPDGGWGIREVKSATAVRDGYLDDLAVQRLVVEGSGLPVRSVELVHVNRDYVRGDGAIDWRRFFTRVELATEAIARAWTTRERAAAMRAILARGEMPAVEPSRHCFAPYACGFWAYCTREKPADWVFGLPRVSDRQLAALREAGVERIADVPEGFVLKAVQARARQAVLAGEIVTTAELAGALAGSGPPAHYLDFETMNPAVPLYPGMRPYGQVPVQWSLHHVGADGAVTHTDFLADPRQDPRRAFVEALVAALGGRSEPIVVYSGFERRALNALAGALPEWAAALGRIAGRLADLYAVVFRHVYHPGFGGSFSLKNVAPALVPGFGYGDLGGVSDGGAAAEALVRLAMGAVGDAGEAAALREALLAYCARDTLALVELHRLLRRRCA